MLTPLGTQRREHLWPAPRLGMSQFPLASPESVPSTPTLHPDPALNTHHPAKIPPRCSLYNLPLAFLPSPLPRNSPPRLWPNRGHDLAWISTWTSGFDATSAKGGGQWQGWSNVEKRFISSMWRVLARCFRRKRQGPGIREAVDDACLPQALEDSAGATMTHQHRMRSADEFSNRACGRRSFIWSVSPASCHRCSSAVLLTSSARIRMSPSAPNVRASARREAAKCFSPLCSPLRTAPE